MGRITNWASTAITFLSIWIFQSTSFAQNLYPLDSGLYFLIQIDSIHQDTIYFTTIEIYAARQFPDIDSLTDGTGRKIIPTRPHSEKFRTKSFSCGTISSSKKRFTKRDLGSIMLVCYSGLPEDISQLGCVNFYCVVNPKEIKLKKLFPLPRLSN